LSKNCIKCNTEIPVERLEAIPGTLTCVKCSDVGDIMGFMVFDHKTAPYVIMVNKNNKEAVRQAKRANRRAR
jgi:hypothetical protein